MLTDDELLRYSRQIMLPDVDIAGQERWRASKVLIVGLGGLGSPVAMYLAAAGVGELVLVDDDEVDLTNLQRQVLHTTARIGTPKVASAAQALAELNPHTRITPIAKRCDEAELLGLVTEADLVLDCTDNFTTRHAINRACVASKTPLVSGAAIRMEGQVAVFQPQQDDSPCYHCLYKESDDENLTCADSGVLAPVVGIIGSLQALEALKVLANVGESLTGRLLIFDAKETAWRTLKLRKDASCAVCGIQE